MLLIFFHVIFHVVFYMELTILHVFFFRCRLIVAFVFYIFFIMIILFYSISVCRFNISGPRGDKITLSERMYPFNVK